MAVTRYCFLFDVDGTLADCEWRRHYVDGTGPKKDWEAFYAAGADDPPMKHVVAVAQALNGFAIVYATGRPEKWRQLTREWLLKHRLPPGQLFMRADGDFRADDVVKAEMLAEIRKAGFEVHMAFDDRDRVVAMWRAHGVPCAQVAEGAF